jgi:hypothetical protein
VDEVGRGLARAHALLDEAPCGGVLRIRERFFEVRVELVERQPERVEDEPRGLVERVGRAVAVGDPGGLEFADGVREQRMQPARSGSRFRATLRDHAFLTSSSTVRR